MKTLLLVILGTVLGCGALEAQILVNGDFENGTAGWAFSGDAAVSSAVPVASGTAAVVFSGTTGQAGVVSQSLVTTPGQAYRVTFAMGETNGVQAVQLTDFAPGVALIVTLIDDNGYHLAFTEFGTPISGTTAYVPLTVLFTATTANTRLSFTDFSHLGAGGALLLDYVTVQPIAPFTRPGQYRGTLRLTRTIQGTTTTTAQTIPVTARVWPSGAFTGYFNNSETTFTGSIAADDGSVTYGNTETATGTATLRGNVLRMTVTEKGTFGGNFNQYVIDSTRAFVLTRVGP